MATNDQMATYQSEEGYGKYASWCIGHPGGVAFNWISKVSDRRIYKI